MKDEICKGDIYYAKLDGTVGSEQSGVRPVIIVQNNIGNKFSPTVIIIPFSRSKRKKISQPTHLKIRPYGTALAEQIRVIDRKRLDRRIGKINNNIMREVDKKILIALDI